MHFGGQHNSFRCVRTNAYKSLILHSFSIHHFQDFEGYLGLGDYGLSGDLSSKSSDFSNNNFILSIFSSERCIILTKFYISREFSFPRTLL